MENNHPPKHPNARCHVEYRQVLKVDPVFEKWLPGGAMINDRLLLAPENFPFAIDVTCDSGAAHLAAAKTANQIIERIML